MRINGTRIRGDEKREDEDELDEHTEVSDEDEGV